MNPDGNTTILLNIYERLGAIESQLKTITKENDGMTVDINALKLFEGRLSAYIWLGGSIASGVMFFMWEGLKYAADKWLHH